VRDDVIELDDDMTKSAPVEMAKFVFDPLIELDVDMTKSPPVEMMMLRNTAGGSGLDIKIWASHVQTAYVDPDSHKPEVVYKEPAPG
jgi:hypothetical protein